MPTYVADHKCPKRGFQGFRFFHERADAVSADCPGCGKNVPVSIVKEGRSNYNLEPLAPGRCGCLHGTTVLEDGRRAYLIKPCSPSCEFYVFAQQESARQGKPIQFRGDF